MPRKGKCFSTCRKRPKSDCDPPECYYTNGNKYKYCRLSFTKKMNKDCVPVLRKKPDSFLDTPSTRRSLPRKRYVISPLSPTPTFIRKLLKRAKTPSGTPPTRRRVPRSPSRSISATSPYAASHHVASLPVASHVASLPVASLTPRYGEYMTPPQTPSKTRKIIPEIINLRPSKEEVAAFREKYTKKTATRKIGKFLRQRDPRVRAKFLQSVCSDAGVCIAFGTNAATIRKHFDDFDNFDLLSKPAEQIGSVSANGFVKELTYVNRGYVANAVLKSAAYSNADNLLYEALVGFFLNNMSQRYPSFVETYGLYGYSADGLAYKECKDNKLTNHAVLSAGLTKLAQSAKDIGSNTVKASCISPISMAVLIQHLKSAKTIREKCYGRLFVTKDLLYVLYQVYMTLASLSEVFTHYDLHTDNVLVYEPVAGSHIEYHYHMDGGKETVFRSKYIAKIIDYGRCYYKDESSTSNTSESKSFYDNLVCKVCKPRCGTGRGYGWMEYKANQMKRSSYISSQRVNPSHDLRLLYSIGNKIKGMDPKLQTLMGRVVYGRGVSKGKEMYGTEPRTDSGYPMRIHNVNDAFTWLEELVKDPMSEVQNDIDYRGSKKLGELHIYGGDRPMRWVPSTK